MPKRNLHIVNPNNPLFGICERCNARFTSFAYNSDEATRQVQAAFDDHKCHSSSGGQNDLASKPTK
ncbi:MAG TPA: hypothetical protein VKQ11_03755 [Candidatus Sulfotelmatobacter sp.]|nr:hypothetical protein [Candidatus Sulfotelmatobacter sp.]